MFARCLDSRGTTLEDNKEYQILQIYKFPWCGELLYRVAEDKLWYSSNRFTVTYTK